MPTAHRGPLVTSFRLVRSSLCALFVAGAALAGEIPSSLKPLVLHPNHRAVAGLELAGTRFESLATFSALPFLLWPDGVAGPTPFPRDRAAAEAWLARVAPELGHRDFVAAYEESFVWRSNEVWSYRLRRGGLPLRDARVLVHWDERGFVGLVNELAGAILSVEESDAPLSGADWIYYPRPSEGGLALVLARQEVSHEGSHVVTSFRSRAGELLLRSLAQSPFPASGGPDYVFTEYPVVSGEFPDQIDADSTGRIWYSQPNDDLIGSFHPVTERFARYAIRSGVSGPDGLIVGRGDRIWTGLFYGGGLGTFDIASGTFASYAAPYASAAMAIPFQSRDGHVWVTDHLRNRVSEFDPQTHSWVSSHVMPSPSAWVVAGAEDTAGQRIYFTEYNVNRLAVKPPGEPPVEIPVPGLGPAFLAVSGRTVYYSIWNQDRLGAYDIETGTAVVYPHPVPNELGGPLARTPGGDIVIGTRNRGYILVFDVETETFASYAVPTPFPGLKDGLTVDRHGVIWFTESGVNKIARLELE